MEQEISLSDCVRGVCVKNFPSLKITALKEVRTLTGLCLMHAKIIVEHEWEVLDRERTEERTAKEYDAWTAKGHEMGWL